MSSKYDIHINQTGVDGSIHSFKVTFFRIDIFEYAVSFFNCLFEYKFA